MLVVHDIYAERLLDLKEALDYMNSTPQLYQTEKDEDKNLMIKEAIDDLILICKQLRSAVKGKRDKEGNVF